MPNAKANRQAPFARSVERRVSRSTLHFAPVDVSTAVGTHININFHRTVAIAAPPALGWEQNQAAATTLPVSIPQPVATTGAGRKIDILYQGHLLAPWNLRRKDLPIDIPRTWEILRPNVDREDHISTVGQLCTMRDSRLR
ncbi:MAG: hypothetical protein DME76_19995 [Verrucomicrobia bacterium]|nr:MAG: hypothetical protein DME76_19995 [Verrucomicrobiota bacterium]